MIKEDYIFAAIMSVLYGIANDPEMMYYAGVFMAAALGIIMRVGYFLTKDTFRWKTLGIQLLIGFPVTFLVLQAHKGSTNIHLWVFFYNFMALFLLDTLDKLGKITILEWGQMIIDRIKGKEGEE